MEKSTWWLNWMILTQFDRYFFESEIVIQKSTCVPSVDIRRLSYVLL